MGSWTKEPWKRRGCQIESELDERFCIYDEGGHNENDADRIVACVNAMRGIPDPPKEAT
jgi:hypothetical protein